ncbi:CocE/NonD family hydrolase [Pseudomonas fluorescens]|uniref:CocE/NonD family hydrolase n=1 Tax=Pseudomonas fluorescens TaxID=294 RepID=UPI001BEA43AE|nr:CocE/NonD family hydrolase [Pseudomonas fluorescens]MBT2374903.1 CocE/NonD family hydrolase [Pseudomonas fluorescens]
MQMLYNQMIPMRDGVHLATDIYLPQGLEGPFPVVIERTPYDKSKPSRSEKQLDGQHISREQMAARFTAQGFVAIFQDCRGRYGSEGVFTKYTAEGEDGFDTLAWIVEQSWCNGNVGSMGLSYAAHTQLAMACLHPPGLCSMVLDSGGFANAYQCGIRQGGAFELKQATWAWRQAKESPAALADPLIREALEQEDIHYWFSRMPWQPGQSPLRHVPEYEAYVLDQWAQGAFGSYWKKPGIYAEGHYEHLPDIPVLFMSSWYDAYVSSTLANYAAFHHSSTRPQQLIMGPWLHGDRNISHSGDVEFGPNAAFDGQVAKDWLSCRLDWFEQSLKPTSKIPAASVAVFLMGGGSGAKDENGRLQHGGRWLHGSQWPLPGSQTLSLYLNAQRQLVCTAPGEDDAHLGYHADPADPVPTIGGALTSGAPVFVGGAFDQRERPDFFGTRGDNSPLAERSDVLSFQTEPLSEDLIVAGTVQIELWIDSDAPDTDFTAKLVDVYPPSADYPEGFAMNITDGIRRCRYRDSWEQPALMKPGERVKVLIEPFSTCNLFKQGHRLRLDIASGNFPHFDVNPNSGEAEGQAQRPQVAYNRVHLSQDFASRLILSVLPAGAVPDR